MRLYVLDLVRFLAAFCVLVYHYKTEYLENLSLTHSEVANNIYSITKFGYLGVNLFFMISGFVILYSSFHRTLSEFVVSRGKRLYPTYWVCMCITTIVSLYYSSIYGKVTLYEFLFNTTLFNDYFNVVSIDGVYWTLHAELKFYACIAALIVFGIVRNYKIWMTIWLFLTILFSITSQPFFMGWFIDPYYSSYFLAGTAFFVVYKKGLSLYIGTVLLLSMLISIHYACWQIDDFVGRSRYAASKNPVLIEILQPPVFLQ